MLQPMSRKEQHWLQSTYTNGIFIRDSSIQTLEVASTELLTVEYIA